MLIVELATRVHYTFVPVCLQFAKATSGRKELKWFLKPARKESFFGTQAMPYKA